MPGPTRLYQRAGSPLIHGRSRYERVFGRDWALALLFGALIVYAVYGTMTMLERGGPSFDSAIAAWRWARPMVPGLGGLLPGSAFGVWLARAFGWRTSWLPGAIVGAIAGFIVILAWRAFA